MLGASQKIAATLPTAAKSPLAKSTSPRLEIYKNVERQTYTYIAYPGFFLAFEGLRSLVWGLITNCWGKEVGEMLGKVAHSLAIAFEVSLAVGLLMEEMWSDLWENKMP